MNWSGRGDASPAAANGKGGERKRRLWLTAGLLALANLLYFAWTQGGLAALGTVPAQLRQAEPQRLTQQVRPELLQIRVLPTVDAATPVPSSPKSAAVPAPAVAPAASPAPLPRAAPAAPVPEAAPIEPVESDPLNPQARSAR